MAEFEGSDRRAGLWAREFARADGDDKLAKARYLATRVGELQLEEQQREMEARQALEAAQEKRIAEMDALSRCAHLRAREDKSECPNCRSILPADMQVCPHCKADFAGPQSWKPKRFTGAVSSTAAISSLSNDGYLAVEVPGGWRIHHAGDNTIAAYAFSEHDLAGLSQLAQSGLPLALWIERLLSAEERQTLLR